MKFSMPILAIVVALLFVASQSVYTVDQRKYAVKFQLGEVVETKTTAGLYFKMPLVQNVKFYDKVNLTLDNPEPDRMTTSEKKPLLVDFVVLWRIIDVRQYYISVQGDEEAARRRLSQTVRANLADAYRQAQTIKGEGDAKSSAIYAQAYGQNAEFYSFYRSLDAYKSTFRSKSDLMVLDPSADFFQYFKQNGPLRAPARGTAK